MSICCELKYGINNHLYHILVIVYVGNSPVCIDLYRNQLKLDALIYFTVAA